MLNRSIPTLTKFEWNLESETKMEHGRKVSTENALNCNWGHCSQSWRAGAKMIKRGWINLCSSNSLLTKPLVFSLGSGMLVSQGSQVSQGKTIFTGRRTSFIRFTCESYQLNIYLVHAYHTKRFQFLKLIKWNWVNLNLIRWNCKEGTCELKLRGRVDQRCKRQEAVSRRRVCTAPIS